MRRERTDMSRREKRTKRAILGAAAFLGAVSLWGPVGAWAQEGEPFSNVWLEVIDRPSQDRISVTVPMACGFVVVGSEDETNAEPISAGEGTLLLPNLRVEDADGNPTLEDTGNLMIKNYSTTVAEDVTSGPEAVRTGLPVRLAAYMEEEPGAAGSSTWMLSQVSPASDDAGKRRYRLSLYGAAFAAEDAPEGFGGGEADGGQTPGEDGGNGDGARFWMDGIISLEAPPDVETNGCTAGGTANLPWEQEVALGAEVGGTRGDYSQVENSVKVGRIHWRIEADESKDGN